MPVPWIPNFGTYHAWYENQTLVFFTVDTDADVEKRGSHTYLCVVRVQVQAPDERGMPSRDEGPAIDRIGERIASELERDWDAWQIGRETHSGQVTFVFYLGNKPLLDAQKRGSDQQILVTTAPHWGTYELTVDVTQDPDWLFYTHSLSPNEIQAHLIDSYRWIQQLAAEGDNPAAERELQHVAVFMDEPRAQAASLALEAAGYVTAPTTPGESGTVVLPFTSRGDLTGFGIETTLAQVLPPIEAQDGVYAGWRAKAVTDAGRVTLS